MAMQTKIGYGNKTDIDTAISESKIDSGDLVVTKDTEELAFIKPDNSKMFIKSRSTKEYKLNGTDLGALKNGDTIPTEIDMDGFLQLITQKPIAPTYTQPTVSIAKSGSGTASGNYESGTSITPILTATFNKNDAGDLTKLAILKGSSEVGSDTSSPYTYTGDAIVLGDETITFKAQATYEDGEVKNNNLGHPDATGQIKAGTKDSSNFVYTGSRNMFYSTGVGDIPEITSDYIRGLSNKKLSPTQGYNFTINMAVGQQFFIIAYPSTLRDINKINYVEGNDPNMAASLTKTTINVADARGGENGMIEYKVFYYKAATPFAASGTMQVTI